MPACSPRGRAPRGRCSGTGSTRCTCGTPGSARRRPAASGTRPAPRRAAARTTGSPGPRSEEHTSELQSQFHLVCRLLLEKKNQPAQDHQRGGGLAPPINVASAPTDKTLDLAKRPLQQVSAPVAAPKDDPPPARQNLARPQ